MAKNILDYMCTQVFQKHPVLIFVGNQSHLPRIFNFILYSCDEDSISAGFKNGKPKVEEDLVFLH